MSKTYDEVKSAEQFRHGRRMSSGLRIAGQISGNEDFVIEGKVEGPVQLAEGKLTVGEKGTVKGNVIARETVVHGTGSLGLLSLAARLSQPKKLSPANFKLVVWQEFISLDRSRHAYTSGMFRAAPEDAAMTPNANRNFLSWPIADSYENSNRRPCLQLNRQIKIQTARTHVLRFSRHIVHKAFVGPLNRQRKPKHEAPR